MRGSTATTCVAVADDAAMAAMPAMPARRRALRPQPHPASPRRDDLVQPSHPCRSRSSVSRCCCVAVVSRRAVEHAGHAGDGGDPRSACSIRPLVLDEPLCASDELDKCGRSAEADARGRALLGSLARRSAGAAARGFDAGTSAWRRSAADGRARRGGGGVSVWVVLAQRGVDPRGDPRADRRRAWRSA